MPQKPHNFRALSKPKLLQKREHRHYYPYIPVLLLVIATFFASIAQPLSRHGVLSYATSMNQTDLLNSTNVQREDNHILGLQLNSQLAQAAQAKANDMVARNYWSHNTPDGQEPWVFINNASYKFQKAGENLAYGFRSGDAAVTGWMNSPPHRANVLDASFTEVGFGYANSSDYHGSGPETVVVAMYGRPQSLPVPVPTAPTTNSTPANTDKALTAEPSTQQVTKVQTLSSSAAWAPFVLGLLSGVAACLLLLKHAAGLRHVIKNGERFILHHPLLDSVLISIVLAGTFMAQTAGFIR